MKNWKKCLCILLVFAMLLFVLSGCTPQENGDEDTDDQSGEEIVNPDDGSEDGDDTEEQAGPTDEEIKAAYDKAVEAYGWFDMTTMPTDSDDTQEENGNEYYKVTHSTITTYAELEAYLKTLFSTQIVDFLLNDGGVSRYKDFNGQLYALLADRGSDVTKGEETYKIIRETDTSIDYQVTVEVLDEEDITTVVDHEVYDFNYEKINDQWVFTNFRLVR